MSHSTQNIKKGICEHYNCDHQKKDVIKCKHCGRYFCKEHINPNITSIDGFSNHNDFKVAKGHGCGGYSKHLEHEKKIRFEKETEGLDIIAGKKIKNSFDNHEKFVSYKDLIKDKIHNEQKQKNYKTHLSHKNKKSKDKKRHEYHKNKNPPMHEEYIKEYINRSNSYVKFNNIDKFKKYIKIKYNEVKFWFYSRQDKYYASRYYNNWNNLFMNFLWIVVFSLSFMIIYSNLEKLNGIIIWFLPLGVILLLINAYFWLKFFKRLINKILKWYKGERNGVKFILMILLIILLWQGYQYQDTLFDSAIEKYDDLNISSILFINISKNISDESILSERNIEVFKESISQNVNEFMTVEPISDTTMNVEKEILKYTNVERKLKDLNTLKWDSRLATVARDHSLDMVENNFFSHDNLRGEDPTDRALRHSYNIHKDLGGGWSSEGIGENIGMMPTGDVVGIGYVFNDGDSIAQAQVESWMGSPGHRENILDSQYTNLGVGCAYDGLYYVCTQNFY